MISIYRGLDIMMLIESIGLSGTVSYSLSTRVWCYTTETSTTVAELLLVDSPGHSLDLWSFGKGCTLLLGGSKAIYSMDPHTSSEM